MLEATAVHPPVDVFRSRRNPVLLLAVFFQAIRIRLVLMAAALGLGATGLTLRRFARREETAEAHTH